MASTQETLDHIHRYTTQAKGNAFEKFVLWLLQNVEPWSSQVAQAWRWMEWPDRDGPDRGIDVVVQTHSGELWAVQCKAHTANAINSGVLKSFLDKSSDEIYAHRMLFSITDRITKPAKELLASASKPTETVLLSELEKIAVVCPSPSDWTAGELPYCDSPAAEYWRKQWAVNTAMLKKFVEREGHARVPVSHLEEGHRLGPWVAGMRAHYKAKILTKARIEELEKIPGWSWNAHTDRWERMFQALGEYNLEHESVSPPSEEIYQGLKLGKWVAKQRTDHGTGKIRLDRKDRLEALTGWTWTAKSDLWDQGFQTLLNYVNDNGHSNPPYANEAASAGNWVAKQRSRKATLSPERQARLEALPGWSWARRDDRLKEMLEALEKYFRAEGHLHIPATYKDGALKVGAWVAFQRKNYHAGICDPERIKVLEEVAGWHWSSSRSAWDSNYVALTRYVDETGTADPAWKCKYEGKVLGQWVCGQRRAYKQGDLEPAQTERLEALPGWLWSKRA